MEDFLSKQIQNSSFRYSDEQVSSSTVEFVKKPSKNISYIFIAFILIAFITSFTFMLLAKVAITIEAPSVVTSQTPLIMTSAELDLKVEEIAINSGQKVQKGEAIVLGEARVKTDDYLKYREEISNTRVFLKKLKENQCNTICLKEFKQNSIRYFRYFKTKSLNSAAQHLRESIFKLKALPDVSNERAANALMLKIFDIEQLVELNQNEQIIHAPADGIILLANGFTTNSFVKKGEKLFDIIPENNNIIIKSYVKDKDITKIKKGMSAQVAIDAFPSREYGLLLGNVDIISLQKSQKGGNNDFYEVLIKLKTNFFSINNKKEKLLLGMKGKVIFVTQHTTLFKKYFGTIMGLD